MQGKALCFGDNVDTDQILPARYLFTTDAEELARHALEGADPEIVKRLQRGMVIVAGRNFGCGSSREHAPLALKHAGYPCLIAKSFARIFYRNALNIGLPICESPAAAAAIADGDEVRVNTEAGTITVKNAEFAFEPYPPELREMIAAGGLMEYVKRKLGRRESPA